MANVSLSYKKMGIPVPIIARGVNPHESIRQSMFTLEGPVLANDEEFAGNHRLVMLDPMGGMPAFAPLAGYETMEKLITALKEMCPTYEWTVTPEPPTTQTILKEAETAVADAQLTYLTNLPEGKTVTITVPDLGGESQSPAKGDHAVTSETDAEQKALLAKYEWDQTVPAQDDDPYDSHFLASASIVEDTVDLPGNADAQLTEIIDAMRNRLFVIRAGKEFAEMPMIDPVITTEYEGIDAADDTCVRLHKGRIANLCVLDLTDDPELKTYADHLVEGECACLFFSLDGSKVDLAPASFGTTGETEGDYTGPFSGWIKVVLPNIVVNSATVKISVGKDSVKHTGIYLDITCC